MNVLQLTPFTFLIVCPLVFLAGFVDAIAGGGGIISLPAYLFAGLPVHNALATNKLSSFCGTTIATGRYLKNKCYEKVFIPPTVAAALAGSVGGARLALIAGDELLKKVLLVVLPVVAVVVVFRRGRKDASEESGTAVEAPPQKNAHHGFSLKVQLSIATAASFVIGMYDGFYGPGTGTFIMLVFTGVLGFDERTAAGNTKCMNWASNAAALATFITGGKVVWALGAAAAVCSIAGNYCGSGLVIKDGEKYVRPVIIVVLVLLFVKILSGK